MSAAWGVMQGRLTNKGGFFPQQFPWEGWKDEFQAARALGMDCIEWMFNMEDFERNPLWTREGRKAIRAAMEATGVRVHSVCANYFMKAALIGELEVLERLLDAGEALEIGQIVLPLFEASEVADADGLTRLLERIEERAGGRNLRVCIEADAPVEAQIDACAAAGSERIGICYDVGNAAGMGRDCVEDLRKIMYAGGGDCSRYI